MIFWRRSASECEQSRSALSEYLDRQLADSKRQAVALHLERCDRCASELAALRHTVEALGSLPTLPTPRSFVLPTPVVAATPSPWYFYARNAAAAVAALLVLTVGLNFTSAVVSSPTAAKYVADANRSTKSAESRVTPDRIDSSAAKMPAEAAPGSSLAPEQATASVAAAPMAAPAPSATAAPAAAAQPQAARAAPSDAATVAPPADTKLTAAGQQRGAAGAQGDDSLQGPSVPRGPASAPLASAANRPVSSREDTATKWPLFEAQIVLAGVLAALVALTLVLRPNAPR